MVGQLRFIASYWGKAQPRNVDFCPPCHPAAYHNLDVAAVGSAMLDAWPSILKRTARLAGLPDDIARRWLLFALSLHDLGKFADCFQCIAPEHWAAANRAFWEERGSAPLPMPHGAAGHLLWHDAIGERVGDAFRLERQARDTLAFWLETAFGHHGRPIISSDARLRATATDDAIEDAAAFALAAATLFELAGTGDAEPDRRAIGETASWLIAGLSVIADWIGSNQDWFPYTEPNLSFDEYWVEAHKRAKRAVAEAGLARAPVSERYGLGDALNRAQASATPLQDWAATAPLDSSGPHLAFLEDLTGSGKTEAALILAHRLMARGDASGLYWALPTQATANALYGRLRLSYRKLFGERAVPPSLALAHGGTDLQKDFNDSIFRPAMDETVGRAEKPYDNKDDDTASAFASDRRRSLLAHIGVGTVDQALLAALPVKFQSLRLTALSERVLIVDEAHSYDKYTTRLLRQALTFQATLGGSAIILSATLTSATKNELLTAFAEGAGWASKNRCESIKCRTAEFPLASLLSAPAAKASYSLAETPLLPQRGTRRDLAVTRLENAGAAVASLVAHARAGRCAVWIRNTVQDAIDGADALCEAAPEITPWLFHARFALADRAVIEKRVIENIGKDSDAEQRAPGGLGRILVATQVIEQSLDLDFDAMVTDLAPIDLLIQRAGRLHRHERGARAAPVLEIVAPAPVDGAAADWFSKLFPRASYVYPHPGHLWRTMRLLQDAGALRLASENPRALLHAVFDTCDYPEAFEKQVQEWEGKCMGDKAVAAARLLDPAKGYCHQQGSFYDEARSPTRLGDEQRVARLAKWESGRLVPWAEAGCDEGRAWRMSEIQLRAAKAAGRGEYPPEIEKAAKAAESAWTGRAQEALLLPLTSPEPHLWKGNLLDAKCKPHAVVYDALRGLRFLPKVGSNPP